MAPGIHIHSHLVVPDDYNLTQTIKIPPKDILWTSKVLLNYKIYSKILVWFYHVHYACVLIISYPLKSLWITEYNKHLGPFTEKVTAFILKMWHFSRCFATSDKIKATALYKEKRNCTTLSSRKSDRPWLVFVTCPNKMHPCHLPKSWSLFFSWGKTLS